MRSPYRQAVDAFLRSYCPVPTRGRALDIGGGRQRGLWQRSNVPAVRWSILDPEAALPEPGTDRAVGRVEDGLLWPNQTFELVTAIDVLYMVPVDQMQDVLRDVCSVLRPGGTLVATFPFSRPESELTDAARYTSLELRRMAVRAHFDRVAVLPLGGWWSVLLTLLWDAAPARMRPTYVRLAPWALYRDRLRLGRWAMGYGLLARKPEATEPSLRADAGPSGSLPDRPR